MNRQLYLGLLSAALCLLVALSCSKKTSNTNLLLRVSTQMVEDGDIVMDSLSVVYIFEGDTTLNRPDSYEDAANQASTAELKGVYDTTNGAFVVENLTEGEWVGVVCDTADRIYYYRNFETATNLEKLYLQLTIKDYLFTDTTHVDNQSPWVGRD